MKATKFVGPSGLSTRQVRAKLREPWCRGSHPDTLKGLKEVLSRLAMQSGDTFGNFLQQKRVYPIPLGAGSARPNPKMGAPDPENPLFLGFSVLRGGLRSWSPKKARPWSRGRSGDCDFWTLRSPEPEGPWEHPARHSLGQPRFWEHSQGR